MKPITIHILTKNVLLIAVLVWFCGSSHADEIDSAIAAVTSQDYPAALRIFEKLAKQGNSEAQYNLAILYRQGKGGVQDNKLAFKWFEAAAKQGLPDAQFYVGYYYDKGEVVTKDSAIAIKWYKKAAEHGNSLAQANLGVAYANGEGVEQDIILAYVWFGLAASQGVSAALDNQRELKQHMSDELSANAQRLTQDYFAKFVAPFQNHSKNDAHGPHGYNHQMQSPSTTKAAPGSSQ